VKWDKKTLGGDPNGLVTLAAGSGSQTLTMLSTRTFDAASKVMTDDVKICSVTLPELTALPGLGGTKLNIKFPDTAFDSATPIKAMLKSTLAAAPAVGTTFTSDDSAVLVGLTMTNPVTDPFPAVGSIQDVDADSDTNKGVTAVEKGTGIPTSALGPNADTLFLAFRSVAKVTNGTMTTCDTSEGVLSLTSINQTIIGCKIKDTGAVCTEDQRKFVDDNSPVWQPDTAPSTIKTKRIDAGKTCADVRGMTF
jgi:hypothetical protein